MRRARFGAAGLAHIEVDLAVNNVDDAHREIHVA
jgi:hypothetical protein